MESEPIIQPHRRKEKRYKLRQLAILKLESGETLTAGIQDISAGGVLVSIQYGIPEGAKAQIEVPLKSATGKGTVRLMGSGKVVRVTELPVGVTAALKCSFDVTRSIPT